MDNKRKLYKVELYINVRMIPSDPYRLLDESFFLNSSFTSCPIEHKNEVENN